MFNDAKYLSTNESTIVEAINDIGDINLASSEIADNIVEGRCTSVMIKKAPACVTCNNTFSAAGSSTHDDGEMVTCNSCSATMLCGECEMKPVCTLSIKAADGKVVTYTSFNDGLQSFLVSIASDKAVDELSNQELKKMLLAIRKWLLTIRLVSLTILFVKFCTKAGEFVYYAQHTSCRLHHVLNMIQLSIRYL